MSQKDERYIIHNQSLVSTKCVRVLLGKAVNFSFIRPTLRFCAYISVNKSSPYIRACIVFSNSVHTSQKAHSASVTKTGLLMTLRLSYHHLFEQSYEACEKNAVVQVATFDGNW